MSIFNSIGSQQPTQQGQQMDMRQEVSTIKQNPASYLKGKGFTIPDNMTDARDITQHLLRTGQVGGGRLQQVMRMIGAIR